MTWLKMRTRPCETEFPTWKKGSMTKMMKLPVYVLHWPMRYDASIPLNQQKVRFYVYYFVESDLNKKRTKSGQKCSVMATLIWPFHALLSLLHICNTKIIFWKIRSTNLWHFSVPSYAVVVFCFDPNFLFKSSSTLCERTPQLFQIQFAVVFEFLNLLDFTKKRILKLK